MGLELARWLITDKLRGQLRTLGHLEQVTDVPVDARSIVEQALARLQAAPDDDAVRWLDAAAAGA